MACVLQGKYLNYCKIRNSHPFPVSKSRCGQINNKLPWQIYTFRISKKERKSKCCHT